MEIKSFKIRILAPNGNSVDRHYAIPEKAPPVETITNVVNLTAEEMATLSAEVARG